MKKILGLAAAAAVALSLASAADAQSRVTRAIQVDPTFHTETLNMTAGGYSLLVVTKLIAVDGMFEFCGRAYTASAQLRHNIKPFLRASELMANGKVAFRGLHYFPFAKSEADLRTGAAHCVSTGIKVGRSGSMRIRWSKRSFRLN